MPRIHPKGKNQQTVNPTRPPITPSDYVQQIQPLHTELVKMQNWVNPSSQLVVQNLLSINQIDGTLDRLWHYNLQIYHS